MSDEQKSYYELLGVEPTADRAEIKKAHMRLSRKYHPDSAPDGKGDSNLFKEVQDAWKTLSDEDAREQYDLQRVKKNRTASAPQAASRPRPSAQSTEKTAAQPKQAPQRTAASRSRRPQRVVQPDAPAPRTSIHEDMVAPAETVVLKKPEKKAKNWRDNIPENYTVRFTPSGYTRWAPVLVALWSLIPILLGIKSALTLDSDSLTSDVLQPIGPFLLLGSVVVFLTGIVVTGLLNTRFKALQFAIMSIILLAPLLFLQGNVLILTAIAIALYAAAGFLMDRAIMRNSRVPDYLPTVTKKNIRESLSWGGIPADGAILGAYPLLLETQQMMENLSVYQKNLRLAFTVTTPRYQGAANPLSEDVPRIPILAMAGNRVALVDVLPVQPARIEIDASDYLLVNGIRTLEVDQYTKVLDGWKQHLGSRYDVELFVVLASDGPVQVGPSHTVNLTTMDKVTSEVADFLSYNYTDVDYNLVQAVVPYTETSYN